MSMKTQRIELSYSQYKGTTTCRVQQTSVAQPMLCRGGPFPGDLHQQTPSYHWPGHPSPLAALEMTAKILARG